VNYAPAADKQTIRVVLRPKPVIYDYQVVASKNGEQRGKVLDLDEGLEYIEWIVTYGVGQEWIPVEGRSVTGLNPNIYTFRYKEYAEGNTLYLASDTYFFSLPRAEWTVTPIAGEHLIWASIEPVDIAPNSGKTGYVNAAYFNVKAEDGYRITGVSADRDKQFYHEIEYDAETGELAVIGGSGNLKVAVSVEEYTSPANGGGAETEIEGISPTAPRADSSSARLSSLAFDAAAANDAPSSEPNAAPGSFVDVKADDWYYDGAVFFAALSLVEGDYFYPGNTVAGRELRDILQILNGGDEAYDLPTLDSETTLTREQVFNALRDYAARQGFDADAQNDLSAFADAGEISDWALPALRWTVANGIVKGRAADILAPGAIITRAELAAVLKRYRDIF
jgi:hypothetical protein